MGLSDEEKKISDLLAEVQPMLLFLSLKTDDRGCRGVHEKIERAYIAASYLKEDLRQKGTTNADRSPVQARSTNAYAARLSEVAAQKV